MREGLVEQLFAAPFRSALPCQLAARAEAPIGHEIDVLDVDDQRIEQFRGRLGAGELVDHHIAHEVAQRQRSAIVPIRREQVRAAQTGNRQRVHDAVIGLRIEKRIGRIEIARPGGKIGDVQPRIRRPIDVAGAAADSRLARDCAQQLRRAKGDVAENDHVGLAPAARLRAKNFARTFKRFLPEVGSQRQQPVSAVWTAQGHCGHAQKREECPACVWMHQSAFHQ